MLRQIYTNKFKKDVAKLIRRGKDLSKLEKIVICLQKEEVLPIKNRDHVLVGNYVGRRECHIEPDWLLIYLVKDGDLILDRTGTHSDLFK